MLSQSHCFLAGAEQQMQG